MGLMLGRRRNADRDRRKHDRGNEMEPGGAASETDDPEEATPLALRRLQKILTVEPDRLEASVPAVDETPEKPQEPDRDHEVDGVTWAESTRASIETGSDNSVFGVSPELEREETSTPETAPLVPELTQTQADSHATQFADLEATATAALDEAVQAARAALEQRHTEELASVQTGAQQTAAAVAALQTELAQRDEQLHEQADSHATQFADLEATATAARDEAVQAARAALEQRHTEELASVQTGAQQMAAAVAALQTELAQRDEQLHEQADSHATQFADLEATATAARDEAVQAARAALEQRHTEELASVQTGAQQTAAAVAALQTELAQRDEQLHEQADSHAAQLADTKRQAAEDQKEAITEALSDLERRTRDEFAWSRAEAQQATVTVAELQDELSERDKQFRRASSVRAALEQQHANELSKRDERYRREVEGRADLERRHGDELALARAEAQQASAAVAELQTELTKRDEAVHASRAELEQLYNDGVTRAQAEAQAATAALEDLRTQLAAQDERHQRQADAHAAQLADLETQASARYCQVNENSADRPPR